MSSGPFRKFLGRPVGNLCSRICYCYCGALYRRFDAVFALSENGGATKLRRLGIDDVDVVPLGVEVGEFAPRARDPRLRRKLGLADDQPLLIYVGRLDGEKKPQCGRRRISPAAGKRSARSSRCSARARFATRSPRLATTASSCRAI